MAAAWFSFAFHWTVVVPLTFAAMATVNLVGLTVERWVRNGSWCPVSTPHEAFEPSPWVMTSTMTFSDPDWFRRDAHALRLMMLYAHRPLPPRSLLDGWTNSA